MAGVMSFLNSPIATMGIVFGSVQLLRFVDMTNPRTIMLLRMGYLTSQIFMLLFWLYVRSVSGKTKKGSQIIEIEEPAAPFSGEPPKKKKMTIIEYDQLESRKQLQQIVIGTIIMLVLHVYFGMVQPLFLQIILPWKSLVTQPLVQIHLFGYPATGSLKRPFKAPNPFSEFMAEQTAEPGVEGEEEEVQSSNTTTTTSNKNSKVEAIKDGGEAPKKKKGGRKED